MRNPTPASPDLTGRRHEDRGAALIIAIGFMVLVGLIVGGLAALINSGIGDTVTLSKLRNGQYAADAAVQQGIVDFRTELQQQTPDKITGWCDTSHDYGPTNKVTVRLGCDEKVALFFSGGVFYTRRAVMFRACTDTATACSDASASLILRADVDFSVQSPGATTFVQSWSVIK